MSAVVMLCSSHGHWKSSMLALLHNNYVAAVSKEEKSHLPVQQCSVEDGVLVAGS